MSESTAVTIAGTSLRCRHCEKDQFTRRSVLMDTSIASFFGLEWLNGTADVFVCSSCGCMHRFLAPPVDENSAPSSDDEEFQCLDCERPIPPGFDRCEECGWTYRKES